VSAVNTVLWVFALLLVGLGVLQIGLFADVITGASSLAIGASLVAVAASAKKKSNG